MMEEEDEFSLKYTVSGVLILLKEWIQNHMGTEVNCHDLEFGSQTNSVTL